jgi:hypothetical protein
MLSLLLNHVKFNDYKMQEARRKVYQQMTGIHVIFKEHAQNCLTYKNTYF